jgi:hypothetical protein
MPRRTQLTTAAPRVATALKRNAIQRRALESQLPDLIVEARAAGMSWEMIGDCIDMSVGGAWNLAKRKGIEA